MSYASVSTHAARSRALASLENLRASSHRAWGALGSRSLIVLPMPLPPDVANKAIRADEKSPASKNVLMMFGAVYHQMGKPMSTVSYSSTPSGIDFKAGLHAGSLHSRVLLLEESVQSRSATVYASLGAISNTSAPIASAIRRATASVTPLAEKYATSVFPDIALSLTYRNSVRAKRAYALERARAQGPVLDFRHSWPIAIMDEEKAMFFFAYACLRVSSKPYDWTQL